MGEFSATILDDSGVMRLDKYAIIIIIHLRFINSACGIGLEMG